MRIAIQGGPASFHAVATSTLLGNQELVCCNSFSAVFAALTHREADLAVVACENSLYGTIRDVYDLLLVHEFPVIGQISLHIRQQLIGWAGTDPKDIREIYSHPVALDQCRKYLDTHHSHVEIIEYHDTAEAVRFVKGSNLQYAAAIAGEAAAEAYEMPILQRDIEDETTNFTRFIVVSREKATPPADANHALLVLTAPHTPGALYHALKVFAVLDVNLTNLESRPIRGEHFKYQFFIDAEITNSQLMSARSELEKNGCSIRLLGHFKT